MPGHLRQTAQAGEYSAYAGSCVNLEGDTIGYNDCKGVIKAHKLPLHLRLSGSAFTQPPAEWLLWLMASAT